MNKSLTSIAMLAAILIVPFDSTQAKEKGVVLTPSKSVGSPSTAGKRSVMTQPTGTGSGSSNTSLRSNCKLLELKPHHKGAKIGENYTGDALLAVKYQCKRTVRNITGRLSFIPKGSSRPKGKLISSTLTLKKGTHTYKTKLFNSSVFPVTHQGGKIKFELYVGRDHADAISGSTKLKSATQACSDPNWSDEWKVAMARFNGSRGVGTGSLKECKILSMRPVYFPPRKILTSKWPVKLRVEYRCDKKRGNTSGEMHLLDGVGPETDKVFTVKLKKGVNRFTTPKIKGNNGSRISLILETADRDGKIKVSTAVSPVKKLCLWKINTTRYH